ncbi:MAG: serine aminopeptidase domain-containing protein [Streptosporangiaceae bacterium]
MVVLHVARSEQDACIAQQHVSGRVRPAGSPPTSPPDPDQTRRTRRTAGPVRRERRQPGPETAFVTDYTGPEGLPTRGTVLVVPGRGEGEATYRRFGRRLAADSYRVRVLPAPVIADDDLAGSLERFAAQLAAAAAGTGADGPVRPLVLVGSDTGAAALAALAALVAWSVTQPAAPDALWWPQALVLAALPGYAAHQPGGWDDELDVRTHCGVHRGVLSDDPSVQRGTLSAAVPRALLDAAYASTADLPQLLVVGDADPLADRDALAQAAKALSAARLVMMHGAHHDVLNDLQHRSVAAEVVTFLEALRNEPSLEPIVTVGSSAW